LAVSEKELTKQFDEQITSLDLRLFESIESQTTDLDKRTLLACQLAVRTLCTNYTYLEIGSHLGGSLQPYIVDAHCGRIFSIDKRPAVQADERGIDYEYENNSTQRMLDNLKQVYAPGLEKINCIDNDVSNIDPNSISPKPQICFIDGEHTDEACFRDFMFCLRILEDDGLLVFHDAQIVYNGLSRIVAYLEANQIRFHAYNLPDTVFVIEINDFAIHKLPVIHAMLVDNHKGYLMSLRYNDHYRGFANKRLFKLLRNLKVRVTRSNVSS
jgi:hypothetical protein